MVLRRGRKTWRVPAFWAGANEWRVRFAPPEAGEYRIETVCTDAGNRDLHGQTGVLTALPYSGRDPLLSHGPIRVARDRRHLEFADGTPFLWLADTWWMGLTRRLKWPRDFQRLTADRVAKGFNVVQIVAGLYPDMPAFDERGANEAGFPWERGFDRIIPAYFDLADRRIRALVEAGLVPCIVGCWAYFLPWMGLEKMKRHWRYLVARWGAYPVVWCLAGEAAMVYYDLKLGGKADPKAAAANERLQRAGWSEIGRYVRGIDAHRRLITIHPGPTARGRAEVDDESVMDFEMLQTGHGGADSLGRTGQIVTEEYRRKPAMPVIDAEVNYETILHGNDADAVHAAFWICMLSGAAGHTYGANGIWQMNTRRLLYGPSPHGGTWGNLPWEDAYRLPGARQVALGKALLERYEWWRFAPHPEWIEPHAGEADWRGPYAAGIPGRVRMFYWWHGTVPWGGRMSVRRLERNVRYRGFFFDPRTGRRHPLGIVRPDKRGAWTIPYQPDMADWVMVLEKA